MNLGPHWFPETFLSTLATHYHGHHPELLHLYKLIFRLSLTPAATRASPNPAHTHTFPLRLLFQVQALSTCTLPQSLPSLPYTSKSATSTSISSVLYSFVSGSLSFLFVNLETPALHQPNHRPSLSFTAAAVLPRSWEKVPQLHGVVLSRVRCL